MLNQKNPCKRHSYFSFPSWRFVHLPLFWNFCLKHHVISSYVISSWWPFQRYHRELGRKVFPDANKAGSSSVQLKNVKGVEGGVLLLYWQVHSFIFISRNFHDFTFFLDNGILLFWHTWSLTWNILLYKYNTVLVYPISVSLSQLVFH